MSNEMLLVVGIVSVVIVALALYFSATARRVFMSTIIGVCLTMGTYKMWAKGSEVGMEWAIGIVVLIAVSTLTLIVSYVFMPIRVEIK